MLFDILDFCFVPFLSYLSVELVFPQEGNEALSKACEGVFDARPESMMILLFLLSPSALQTQCWVQVAPAFIPVLMLLQGLQSAFSPV